MNTYGMIVWGVTALLALFTASNLLHMIAGAEAGTRMKGLFALIINGLAVWILYTLAMEHYADVPTMLWDALPSLPSPPTDISS